MNWYSVVYNENCLSVRKWKQTKSTPKYIWLAPRNIPNKEAEKHSIKISKSAFYKTYSEFPLEAIQKELSKHNRIIDIAKQEIYDAKSWIVQLETYVKNQGINMRVLHISKSRSIVKSKSIFNALSVLEAKGKSYTDNFHIKHIRQVLDRNGNCPKDIPFITNNDIKIILSREAKYSDSALSNQGNGWYSLEK